MKHIICKIYILLLPFDSCRFYSSSETTGTTDIHSKISAAEVMNETVVKNEDYNKSGRDESMEEESVMTGAPHLVIMRIRIFFRIL